MTTSCTSEPDLPTPAAPPCAVEEGREIVQRRIAGAAVALASLVVLTLAAVLPPSERGLGTHEALNLPGCGWINTMDLPCPTCGMTTAFAHAADGDLLASFLAQPAGAMLALLTAMGLLIGSYVAVTGSRLMQVMWKKVWGRYTVWWIGGIVLISWLYKMASYRGWF